MELISCLQEGFRNLFEHFTIQELNRFIHYLCREIGMSYLRLHTGLEIDVILEEQNNITAIEIKSTAVPGISDVRNLLSFRREFPKSCAYLVCTTDRQYEVAGIKILPWRDLFTELNLI